MIEIAPFTNEDREKIFGKILEFSFVAIYDALKMIGGIHDGERLQCWNFGNKES